MQRHLSILLSFLAAACSGSPNSGAAPITPDGVPADCDSTETYPTGAVEPMALGETISPYRWPTAIHRGTGVSTPLDLAKVPCNTDTVIDWSPFDVLLFVSIPAW